MMMNIKELSRKERKEIKEEFFAKGETEIYRKANRIYVIAIFGICFAITSIILHLFIRGNWTNFLVDGFLFAFTGYFIMRTAIIKQNELAKYVAGKEQKTKKTSKSKKKK